jgi:hypothetical protein
MKVETVFRAIIDDWTRAKNHCRTTDNKDFTEKEPTDTFKKKLLISEHSPIRTLQYDWTWPNIPYWVSTHWSRHVWTPFISTQRDDRLHDEIPRNEKPQGALVNFDGYANQQHLIDTWRKRLCYCASPETRECAENFKVTLHETHPFEADVLVPNCIYRDGCPEFKTCGFLAKFLEEHKDIDVHDIQARYDAYNKDFYERVKKND